MNDRNNTIAGWVLAACGAALGLSIAGGMIFHSGHVEKFGYPVEAADEGGAGAAEAAVPIAALLPKADAAKGAEVFKKCAACHTINQGGANGVGPNLYATLGEGIAEGKGGFAFSDALKAVGGKWDFDKMNAWLTSPRKFAPGTKMTFAGLSKPEDRADVILYLNTQGSNLPLPAAPAAEPAPAAEQPAAAAPGQPEIELTDVVAPQPEAAAPVEDELLLGSETIVPEPAPADPVAEESAPQVFEDDTPAPAGRRRWLSSGADAGEEAAPAPRVKLGGTLFERMQNASRGTQRAADGEDKDSLDIPRFLHRQNNQ